MSDRPLHLGIVGVGRIGATHARTLAGLETVERLTVTDLDPAAAARTVDAIAGVGAGRVTAAAVDAVPALLDSGIDALVITTGTATHAGLIEAGVAAGLPTFCEKPVAGTVGESIALAELERRSGVPIHIGFQRRFDAGYRRLREAVAAGELGELRLVRAATHDQSPPPAAYLPGSGGIFRDCGIHDVDILRFVTGREVVRAYAAGGTKGPAFFADAGDVDTGAAVLTLDDGTLALVSLTRYHGAGHDVRMEVHGSLGTLSAGLDDSLAIASAQPGVAFPPGPTHPSFAERFAAAYAAELAAFVEVAAGRAPSPCTVADGLAAARIAEACALSLAQGRPVELSEVPAR
ncbi:MAG TPA: Gfo/Idh/MocA family oxidoreductase [Dermatophilaceae bacterium]|nr:Gfo/Idh/MocA family oxidoreductase [Dermatophilaceae bacterium]